MKRFGFALAVGVLVASTLAGCAWDHERDQRGAYRDQPQYGSYQYDQGYTRRDRDRDRDYDRSQGSQGYYQQYPQYGEPYPGPAYPSSPYRP